MIKIMTNEQIDKIKEIIQKNFIERKKNIEDITDDFLTTELYILRTHLKIKHSHHLNSFYSKEILEQIKDILNN